MDKIDCVLSKFFEIGDRYRLAAPITHIVAIFFKVTKDITTGVFRVDLSRYQSRCFDYLNKKSYKVCGLLVIPILGFGYVQKHRLYYYKTDDKKSDDNDNLSIRQTTENTIIEQLKQSVFEEKEEEMIEDLFNSYQYTIGISDDPEDLLLIGTEVNGSCQRIDGEPDKNKCLVGYFLGDALPIIVRDQNGKIIARSFLRLLWDETNKTAVLLLERLYSNLGDHKSICEAISGVASDLAKEMKVPLVSKEIKAENKRPYKGKVQFLGGSAPFIYTDAGGGIKNGQRPFEIIGCHEIL